MKVSVVRETCEKITYVDKSALVFGGFLGGVYKVHQKKVELLRRCDNPIGCILQSGNTTGTNVHTSVVGEWNGEAEIEGEKVKVSEYPIKYIFRVSSEMLVISDSFQLYLWCNGKILSSFYLGTYPLEISFCEESLLCITGYSIHWLGVENGEIKEKEKLEVQKKTNKTETFTSLVKHENGYLCGTIGGWIVSLEDLEEKSTCKILFLLKVSSEKVTDLMSIAKKDKKYFLYTTPNLLSLVDRKTKQTTKTLHLSKDNGIFSLSSASSDNTSVVVFNVNCKLYFVDLFESAEEENRELASSLGDSDEKLFREIMEEES